MRVCPYINEKKRETVAQLEAFDFQFVSYWQKVKKEINNLEYGIN
jgi:preprotein translocase subunit SecE